MVNETDGCEMVIPLREDIIKGFSYHRSPEFRYFGRRSEYDQVKRKLIEIGLALPSKFLIKRKDGRYEPIFEDHAEFLKEKELGNIFYFPGSA